MTSLPSIGGALAVVWRSASNRMCSGTKGQLTARRDSASKVSHARHVSCVILPSSPRGKTADQMFLSELELLQFGWLWVRTGAAPWVADRVQSGYTHFREFGRSYRITLLWLVLGGSLVVLLSWYRIKLERRRRALPLLSLSDLHRAAHTDSNSADNSALSYDVCVVGAGPAGATCAYWLATAGVRVLLLDRDTFPRDKLCGDVVCGDAVQLLREMGVWQKIQERGCFRWLSTTGILSDEESVVGVLRSHRPASVQRYVLDHELVVAARGAGVTVEEGHAVQTAQFDRQTREWRVVCENGAVFSCTVLVAADGAQSTLSRSLGVVKTDPNAVGTRFFVRPEKEANGQLLWQREDHHEGPSSASVANSASGGSAVRTGFPCDYAVSFVPRGPTSLAREVEDYICVATVRPLDVQNDNDKATGDQQLPEEEKQEEAHKDDAGVAVARALLGSRAHFTQPKSAPMRLGGVARCYDSQFLCVGDAAGHCDPLTGMGLLPSMQAARMAAEVIVNCFVAGDVSSVAIADYQVRVDRDIGIDFSISGAIVNMVRRYPSFVSAAVTVVKNRGGLFLSEWIGAYHGSKKFYVQSGVALLIAYQAIVSKVWKIIHATE